MPPTYLVRFIDGQIHGRVCRACGVLLTRTNVYSLRADFCRQHDPDHEPERAAPPGIAPRRRRGRHGR